MPAFAALPVAPQSRASRSIRLRNAAAATGAAARAARFTARMLAQSLPVELSCSVQLLLQCTACTLCYASMRSVMQGPCNCDCSSSSIRSWRVSDNRQLLLSMPEKQAADVAAARMAAVRSAAVRSVMW